MAWDAVYRITECTTDASAFQDRGKEHLARHRLVPHLFSPSHCVLVMARLSPSDASVEGEEWVKERLVRASGSPQVSPNNREPIHEQASS